MAEQKFCLDCAHLHHDANVSGPGAYRCLKAVKMFANFSPLRHTARFMRDGACGKEARFYKEKRQDTEGPQSAAESVTTRR